MTIKRKKVSGSRIERKIITGMITSTEFLREVNSVYKPQSLTQVFTRIIAKWCLEYFKKYQEAPNQHIEDLFAQHSDVLNDDDKKIISKFLGDLSDEYEDQSSFNCSYLLDKTFAYFQKQEIYFLQGKLETSIDRNDVKKAQEYIGSFRSIARTEDSGVDLLDPEVTARSFDKEDRDILFTLPGDLGKFVGSFERGYLIGFLGTQKAGKSFWSLDMGWKAINAGLNVLYISLEMSEKATNLRMHQNICARPLYDESNYREKENENEYTDILIPIFDCHLNQIDECVREERTSQIGLLDSEDRKPPFGKVSKRYKVCTACRNSKQFQVGTWFKQIRRPYLTQAYATQKGKIITKSILRNNKFKFVQFPSGSVTMEQIKTYINNLEYYDGFVPDFIITDYANKIASENPKLSMAYQKTEIWEAHKALAQEKKCLVMSCNQPSNVRIGGNIKQADWADSIAPLSLCDSAWVLNQTPEEKENGIMRVTVVARRHGYFNLHREVFVLQQLAIGRPILDTFFQQY